MREGPVFAGPPFEWLAFGWSIGVAVIHPGEFEKNIASFECLPGASG
jgi:hypothetical protein